MPNISILSSATFPNILHLPCFNDRIIKFIESNNITISCNVNDMNGYVYIPHLNIQVNNESPNVGSDKLCESKYDFDTQHCKRGRR